MVRIFAAALIAVTLFIVGSSQLIAIRNSNQYAPTAFIIEEPMCDEANYLDIGNNLDHQLETEIKSNNKTTETEENNADFDSDNFLVVNEGQTIHSILRANHVSEQEIAKISKALYPYLLPKDLAPKDFYRFSVVPVDANTSILDEFVIKKLDQNRVPILYQINRQEDNQDFQVSVKTPAIVEQAEFITLTVAGTLYQTFNSLPFGHELMQRFMAIFTWEIRMPQDVLSGDHIELLVVKKYALDKFIGYGTIKSVYYRQKNRTFFATWFESKDKKVQGIFNENGKSLEKEFSYSPVRDAVATSNQRWRYHPVLKVRIPHNGVDYRGNGEDFFAIADGTIIEIRFDVNVGNMVRLRHDYGIHSEYFHAESLMKLSLGDKVKKGQKLGTIGRTGRLCTGPHLHVGLYKMQNNKRKYIELASLRKILKPSAHIQTKYMNEFMEHVGHLTAAMALKRDSVLAKSIPQ